MSDAGDSGTPGPSRREFLAGGGTAGLGMAGAVMATRYLGGTRLAKRVASTTERAVPARPTWLLPPPGRPAAADWTALKTQLSTRRLVRPGQAGYSPASELFDPVFDSLAPAGIAYCRTPGDVAACLNFVAKFSMAVRARSGGHSYAGWSSVTSGLIVDVSAMNSFSALAGTVSVGSGLDLIHFYDRLAAEELVVPGGSCPTVGIAGLTLGGGVGVLSRLHGLTSDNLTAVQVVTADGSVLTCDGAHHSDLFWACRGGGGGNFAVATSFTFRAHRLRRLCVFYLTWPWSHAARVVSAWQSWAPYAPDRLWSNLHLSARFGACPTLSVGGTYAGSLRDLASQLEDLYGRAGSWPSFASSGHESVRNAMLLEAGCSAIPLHACHTGPGGQLARVPSYAKSDFFTRPLSAAGISVLLSGIEDIGGITGASGGTGSVAFDACGGAMNKPRPSATAFVHRNALFLAQYSTVWAWPGSPGGVASQRRWLRSYYNSLHPHASGHAYQNYIDPDLADWQHAYYGANYERLTQVKASYDPTNLFSFPQSVELA